MTVKKKRRRSDDHVVMGNDSVRCAHCGDEEPIAMPTRLEVMQAICKSYQRLHKACEPGSGRERRYTYRNPSEWLASWDVGQSALAIYSTFEGKHAPDERGFTPVPADPSDFGRCYRLLRIKPEWRRDLAKVAERWPCWAPYVARWSEMEKLYEAALIEAKIDPDKPWPCGCWKCDAGRQEVEDPMEAAAQRVRSGQRDPQGQLYDLLRSLDK